MKIDPDTQRQVVEAIFANLNVRSRQADVDADTPLFAGCLELDSFGAVELISLLESRFGIQFLESDFREEYFRNIGSLCGLIERRKQR
jgi:acyl carrier protein